MGNYYCPKCAHVLRNEYIQPDKCKYCGEKYKEFPKHFKFWTYQNDIDKDASFWLWVVNNHPLTFRDEEVQKRLNVNVPHCPTCGSTDIEKIGTLDRATSVGFFGLASGKIGKQFKCRNCKYMW